VAISPTKASGCAPSGKAKASPAAARGGQTACQVASSAVPAGASGSVVRPCAVAQVAGLTPALRCIQRALRIGYQVQQASATRASARSDRFEHTAITTGSVPISMDGSGTPAVWIAAARQP
jgi:hypothetical protein